MQIKGIKNIIFDFGGVLINLDRQRCINNFNKLGVSNIGNSIDLFAQQGIFMLLEKGWITPAEFRNKIRELTCEPITDQHINDAWNSLLVDIPTYKLDMLLQLRKKARVFLLSNTNEIHWKWSCIHAFPYQTFCETDYFEQIFLSYKMRLAKPDIEIFEVVLKETGILPQETLFIDDSEANCRSAQSLGIITYHCKPDENWSFLFE